MNINFAQSILAVCMGAAVGMGFAASAGEAKLHKYSTTIEKERPQLNEETKRLISAWRRHPTEANLAALKKQVAANYDKVVERKKAKLEELKRTAKHASKVQEMQEIVDEMLQNREKRIEQSLRRFTDPRLKPGSRDRQEEYLPVIGAARNVSIARTPVTNEEYSEFLKATGRKPPQDWRNGAMPAGKARHPVVTVSYADAAAYCQWLSDKDQSAVYRLPTAEEWEFAAGHMPKDASFNCGENDGTTPVDAYAETLAACGAIDMWGNCREWTSTPTARGKTVMAVKGGSWKSRRTECRTEQKEEGREASVKADDVGFRVIRESKGRTGRQDERR